MSTINIYSVIRSILDSIEPGNFSDETIEKLGVLFSEQLLLAALDLIDRDCVIKYILPWGSSHFGVLGLTGPYSVFPNLHHSCPIPFFCTCPAFSYAVLISQSQLTCKHVLATLIAERLSKCVVRNTDSDEFISLVSQQNLQVNT
ncbi:hypothetical protein B0F90DRAFT_1132845 [Multifurca ochricompacta]|uniref:SWIM-type domain-containing protein n=1 Tax=Multifurca ochricompacta TaxID=376703 RepID=A0AAD4M0N6_9AGAM|nr:hypothetical protein B0F90DRAFT_1132845 [Multifurca ochricompacta]